MKRLLLFIAFVCCAIILKAQQNLSGTVVDIQNKKPVVYANVTLKEKDNTIITFQTTDANGVFSFAIPESTEQLMLEINYLGYQKFQKQLSKNEKFLAIELVPKATLLDEIEIKSKPKIVRSGDTLSYNVQSFSKLEDRSIGDVLKRMPGIEVGDAGQIKYQGKTISNFYIDGDDLLDDRYAIGTRTIPHAIVKDIQVMTNHEHLKVMKNKRYTDNVALNLVIKDDAKLQLTTQAKIGIGLPAQYDAEINNHLFNKKIKFLNVLSGNNIGNNYKGELIGFNQNTLLSRFGNTRINNLLSFGTVGNPPVNRSQYNFNNSFGINANNSFALKKNWVGKLNFNGIRNADSNEYYGERTFLIENQQFGYKEMQRAQSKDFTGVLRLTATKNVEDKYINAKLSLEFENQNRSATLLNNEDTLLQDYNHQIKGFTFEYEHVPQLKNKDLLHSNLYVNYGSKPQELNIKPGVFSSIFNDSISYNATIQQVNVPQFFTNYSLGYRITKGKIVQAYTAGILVENQDLSSTLAMRQTNISSPMLASDSAINNMRWNRIRYYVEPSFDWSYKKFVTNIRTPLYIQTIAYQDPLYKLDNKRNDLLFNPSVSIRQQVGYESEIHFNYAYNNSFGTIENIYRGLVLTNYRSLTYNSSTINESRDHTAALTFRMGRALKLRFYNFGISYSHNTVNNIISSNINNEIIETSLLNRPNTVRSYSVNAVYDSYIFALASTLKLKGSVSLTEYNQLLNERLLPYQNTVYSIGPKFEFKIWEGYNVSYNGDISYTQSRQNGDFIHFNRTFTQINQHISLPFNITKNIHVKLSANHLFTQQIESKNLNYFFSDLFIRYRHTKLKTDLELSIDNLANIKSFDTYTTNANLIAYSSYKLRGRFGMLRVVFNL